MRRIFGELNKTEKTFFRGHETRSCEAAGDLATARNVFSVLCHILRNLFICTSNEAFS